MTESTGTHRSPPADDPAVVEQRTRTHGRWLLYAGGITEILAIALAVVWHVGSDTDIPIAIAVPLNAIGLGAIWIGCLEHLHRSVRVTQHQALERVSRVHQEGLERIGHLERAITMLVELMDEDRQQQFYKGAAWQARNDLSRTGTEGTRPGQRSGEVLSFRGKHHNTPPG